jgi:hypothetical protein
MEMIYLIFDVTGPDCDEFHSAFKIKSDAVMVAKSITTSRQKFKVIAEELKILPRKKPQK